MIRSQSCQVSKLQSDIFDLLARRCSSVYFRCSSLGASVYNSVDSLTMKDLEFTASEWP